MAWRITNVTRQRPLADRAQRAEGFWDRFVGLMGRHSLEVGEGLVLAPCNGIHTFFMRIPIDAAFLDGEGVIVKQFHALAPWRATATYRRVEAVLELPAGVLAASGSQEGDRLVMERAENDGGVGLL